MTNTNQPVSDLQNVLIDMAIDGWKFSKMFTRMLGKLEAGETTRYLSQLQYFLDKLQSNLDAAGMRLVNIEGQPYDSGVAASALNVGDFSADDQLVVDQMVEPIIMGADGLLRSGTIMLRKAGI